VILLLILVINLICYCKNKNAKSSGEQLKQSTNKNLVEPNGNEGDNPQNKEKIKRVTTAEGLDQVNSQQTNNFYATSM
jgi:hypothetical protein